MSLNIHVSKSRQELKINLTTILDEELHLPEEGCMQHDCIRILSRNDFNKPLPTYSFTFDKVQYRRDTYVCSIAYFNGRAVGSLLVQNFDIQYYVKPEYRNNGIASRLLEETKKHHSLFVNVVNRADSDEGITFAMKNEIPMSLKEMHQHTARLRKAISFIREF